MGKISDASPGFGFLVASILIALVVIIAVLFIESYKTSFSPGFGALVALIGLGAVAFLIVRKH